jgi:hypothetical protein
MCTVSISPLIAVTVPRGRSRTGPAKAVLARSAASAAQKYSGRRIMTAPVIAENAAKATGRRTIEDRRFSKPRMWGIERVVGIIERHSSENEGNPGLDLNEVSMFVEVVKTGSFAEASRRLRIPSSRISQEIQQLEDRLGAQLLRRSTRKPSLTGAGQSLFYSGWHRSRQSVADSH